jgi:hypothetical protein
MRIGVVVIKTLIVYNPLIAPHPPLEHTCSAEEFLLEGYFGIS